MTEQEIKLFLSETLTEKRYRHTLAVADSCTELARRFGCDISKAYLAGLLHDIVKDLDTDETLQMIEEFGIILDDIEKNTPKLRHAKLGAEFIKRRGFSNDEDIINAVRYHTTARAGMSLLEKTLYLADFISADRKYKGVEKIRTAVADGLGDGMMAGLCFSIESLVSDKSPIHGDTLAAYNEAASQ